MGKNHRSSSGILFRVVVLISFLVQSPTVFASIDYFSDSFFPDYSYPGISRWGSQSSQRGVVSIGADPKAILDNSLRVAAREDRVGDLKKLLDQGANVNTKTASGITPLMYAARNCSPKLAEILLSSKADVNARDRSGRTPLIYASREGCWRVVELLVKVKGIEPLVRDSYQKTALDYASDDALLEVGGPAQKIMGLIFFARRQ